MWPWTQSGKAFAMGNMTDIQHICIYYATETGLSSTLFERSPYFPQLRHNPLVMKAPISDFQTLIRQ